MVDRAVMVDQAITSIETLGRDSFVWSSFEGPG
jgi:hypothetical protein